MDDLQVSVITPSLNRGSFIQHTIESALNQTYTHIQYIVVDGGSTDGTLGILDSYSKPSLLTYVSEPDSGMYDAINKGLARSRGDILCYINTDDRYLPWSVETAVLFLADHDDIDIVYGDTLVHDVDKDRRSLNILPTFSSMWLRSGGIIPQPTVFFRRRVYSALGGFQQDVKYLADCEYWLRADRAGMRFRKLNEVLAVETNHSGTIRQTVAEILADEKRRMFESYSPSSLKRPWIRTLLHRAKYTEKEMLMLLFFLRNCLGGGRGWARFREAFDIDVNIPQYFLDKLMRTRSDNWKLEERHG